MSKRLLEALENAGFIKRDDIVLDRIDSASDRDLNALVEQSLELTSADTERPAETVFTVSATESLSGGPYPCASLECRHSHVAELARFAALYADRVYIRNPLARYFVHSSEHPPREELIRASMRDDFEIIAELRPLIEAGRVVAITPPGDRCPRCLWESGVGSEERERLKPAREALEETFRELVKITVRKQHHHYSFKLQGPNDLLEHTIYRTFQALPTAFHGDRSLIRRIESGKEVVLRGSARRSSGFDAIHAGQIFSDVIFESALAQSLGTSYLTDRKIHLDVLSAIEGSTLRDQRNAILERHLTSIVPFAGDVPIEKLLMLRQREEESFLMFRQELSRAVDEVLRVRSDFSGREARALYSDVVLPALTNIERKVKLAKRDLTSSALRRASTWVGAISIGTYAGFVPSSLQALATVLGLAKVAQESLEMITNKADVQASVRQDPYYFLWRVRRHRS